ncbi:hypothetical protein [Lacticaseibacillus thailandensis]|nr:hypothetical protein [Lacticaseibacillus thailandensis]
MHLASNMATKDEEMVELQAMQRRLESYCAGGSVTTTDTGTMVFVDHQQVQHKVYQYHSQANGNILRDEGIGGGYVPILMHARKLLVSGLAPNTCAYKVTMDDGLTFRGVLNGMSERQHPGSVLVTALLILLVVGALTLWMVPKMVRWRTEYQMEERINRNALRQWRDPSASKRSTSSSQKAAITGK